MTLLLLDTTFLIDTERGAPELDDLIIAATAAAAGRTVVSADRHAFDGLPGVTALDHRSPLD